MNDRQRVMCNRDIMDLLVKYAPISNEVGAILSLIGLALYAGVEDDLARAVLPVGFEVVKTTYRTLHIDTTNTEVTL